MSMATKRRVRVGTMMLHTRTSPCKSIIMDSCKLMVTKTAHMARIIATAHLAGPRCIHLSRPRSRNSS